MINTKLSVNHTDKMLNEAQNKVKLLFQKVKYGYEIQMRLKNSVVFFTFLALAITEVGFAQKLPVFNPDMNRAQHDWLIRPSTVKAQVLRSADWKDLVLYNGLLRRTFRISPNMACIDFTNLSTTKQLLRAIKEEARLTINGKEYRIGGLNGQKEKAYLLPEWIDSFTSGVDDFKYVSYIISPIEPFLKWDSSRFWATRKNAGSGITVSFLYKPGATELKGLEVRVIYELYDGMPLMVKSISIVNKAGKSFKINCVVNEVLGIVEEENSREGGLGKLRKPSGIYVETNYAFNNAMNYPQSDQTTHWKADTAYSSQVNGVRQTPVLLEVYPEKGPGIELMPGETFQSVRTHEMLTDSEDRERRGLAIRRMYLAVAPWTTANPIFMHLVSKSDQQVFTAIDQCAATGYEAVILSFGSNLNMEDTSAQNISRWKSIADYAHQRKIRIGGYSLFSSRSISPQDDVIDPVTGKPNVHAMFLHAPCFGSQWGLQYAQRIKDFFKATDFDIWENDGPYPGDVCASTTHPGHKGLEDSQWRQMEIQKGLYHWLNEQGIYINSPDWYFLDGTHKIALGYNESNFKLSRQQQKIINRQNIYDCSWEMNPSMSWGMVPLTEYGGGGPEAVLEPLKDHLKDYEQLMMQFYGSGIQACYRGPRLYDTKETKQTVIKVIDWYKKYRMILNSDIIHLRRPDGRDWDGLLHVNPSLREKGLIMLYNSTKVEIVKTIRVPLYYTGLAEVAMVREKEGSARKFKLHRDYCIELPVSIPANGYTWYVIN